jgi:hypothetical protein
MAIKKFFVGLTVLLSVSLFVLGCPAEPDDEVVRSSNATIALDAVMTIRGVTVNWDNPAKTGATIEAVIEGTVLVPVGATASEDAFPAPEGSAVTAVLDSGTLADADAFGTAAADDTKLVTDNLKFLGDGGLTAGTKYLYIRVTSEDGSAVRWYKITITIAAVASNLPSGKSFRIVQIIGDNALLDVDGTAGWYPANNILKAIYEPNAPDAAADDMALDGSGGNAKTAVPFTPALSAEVLKLFRITTTNTTISDIEVTGTDLPSASDYGASTTKLIVIDIGKPGVNNSAALGKVKFHIPDRGLGDGEYETYGHIRLRVNEGAELVILASNVGYINGGAGDACPTGYFNGGCVEVMADGKLRDGAYEGFPLGARAIILNRFGSYLSVGPEPDSADAKDPNNSNNAYTYYTTYYSGYLVGPSTETSARIQWDAVNTDSAMGNLESNYLEVRPGQIATNARFTMKKSAGLIYSVWFLENAHLTIDAGTSSASGGLGANESASPNVDFNFYAPYATDTENPQTIITIKQYSFLDKRFLETPGQAASADVALSPSSSTSITITAPLVGDLKKYADTNITGALITYTAPDA